MRHGGERIGPASPAEEVREGGVALQTLQRSHGTARIGFKFAGGMTRIAEMAEAGCLRVRSPRAEPNTARSAVLINTSGGLTDGDHLQISAIWAPNTCAAITSQAAERIYRSRGDCARIDCRLTVAETALALWLPQETILFDHGRLERRTEARVAEGGRLLACESLIFGRRAMGEEVRDGAILDAWRIRYAGRLVYADTFKISGDIEAKLERGAIADGAKAVATVLLVGEVSEALVDSARRLVRKPRARIGISRVGPVLIARILAKDGAAMRHDLAKLLDGLLGGLAIPAHDAAPRGSSMPLRLPRLWHF